MQDINRLIEIMAKINDDLIVENKGDMYRGSEGLNEDSNELKGDNIVYHGGDKKITKLDPQFIKGGVRANLGWGVYFTSNSYKASTYGKEVTYLDISDLNILDLNEKIDGEFLAKIKELATETKEINIMLGSLYDYVHDTLKDNMGKTIWDGWRIFSNKIKWDTDKTWSEMLIKLGYDGMQQGDYEYVIFNFDKASQYLSENTEMLDEKKKKADRCLRIARRKYDKPSAYRSGAIVRCRMGKIWKDLKEEDINEAPEDIKELLYKAHDGITRIKGEDYAPDVNELKKWTDDHLAQQDAEVDEAKKTDFSKEKKSGLHGWFSRRGGGGNKGWVDCNTCRKVDGKKKCKACGRQKGETRSKYPSCRPTPASCGTPGKGKKWGKTKEESYDMLNEDINRIKNLINY
jgi:hypothetical protein